MRILVAAAGGAETRLITLIFQTMPLGKTSTTILTKR
jgi:hypothetical protein